MRCMLLQGVAPAGLSQPRYQGVDWDGQSIPPSATAMLDIIVASDGQGVYPQGFSGRQGASHDSGGCYLGSPFGVQANGGGLSSFNYINHQAFDDYASLMTVVYASSDEEPE